MGMTATRSLRRTPATAGLEPILGRFVTTVA